MQIKITLSGSGGELASETVTVPAGLDDPDAAVNSLVHDTIEGWLLSAGDSIKIETVAQ
jgi:hypothetical protein